MGALEEDFDIHSVAEVLWNVGLADNVLIVDCKIGGVGYWIGGRPGVLTLTVEVTTVIRSI